MLDLNRRLLLDGGMGTMLQGSGLEPGQAPETLNLTNPLSMPTAERSPCVLQDIRISTTS